MKKSQKNISPCNVICRGFMILAEKATGAHFYILSPIIVVISRYETTKEQNSLKFHSS
ncbi:hypothetical protein [Providencia rettgeri]|uniref:hypothetical protein n=1 Tax=Providencia rettgeri TaxID=587 RepID=UPI0034E6DE04